MILTYRSGFNNTFNLRDAIQELSGVRLRVTCYPERVDKLLIRYGNSSPVNTKDTEYNSAYFIHLCSHKKTFADKLREAGFDTPIFSRETPEANDFPLLIRQIMTGYGAEGIVVCRNMDEFNQNWQPKNWWTRFVHTNAEYRVHVFGDKIGRLFKKEFRGDTEVDLPIRNSYSLYHYSLRSSLDKFPGLVELVKKLSEVLPGKFYGLDVGWRPDTRNYFIFEANSGYGINHNSALALGKYLLSQGILDL